ncbi:MAG: zf-HC2 domain-containing protein [Elusimicrobia bacterium]|nr:zf-HC2 domain-containing protein [Elusimicrobiota bacterium]
MTRWLRCWETRNLLDLFVDGRLTRDQGHRVEDHLAACPACALELEGLKPLPLSAGAPPAMPAGLAAAILKEFEGGAAPELPSWRLSPAQAAGLAAAALLLLAQTVPGPVTRAVQRPAAEALP